MMNKKKIFSLRALLFAVIVTASVSSITLSRYMSTVAGTDTAQIASFKVTLTSTETNMKFNGSTYIGDAEEHVYNFQVESQSDVALTYFVTVNFGQMPPPSNVSLWLDNTQTQIACDGTQTEFTFTNTKEGYSYDPTDDIKQHKLYIQVNYGDGTVGETSSDFNPDSVKITVTAQQSTKLTTNQ